MASRRYLSICFKILETGAADAKETNCIKMANDHTSSEWANRRASIFSVSINDWSRIQALHSTIVYNFNGWQKRLLHSPKDYEGAKMRINVYEKNCLTKRNLYHWNDPPDKGPPDDPKGTLDESLWDASGESDDIRNTREQCADSWLPLNFCSDAGSLDEDFFWKKM